jgi:hypothetical protein
LSIHEYLYNLRENYQFFLICSTEHIRKNWLFSQTVDGADASAFFFSLIETAKRSDLNPMDYVEAICTFGPGCKTDEQWEALLPDKIDLGRLDEMRERRLAAKPDPARTTAYNFVGATR